MALLLSAVTNVHAQDDKLMVYGSIKTDEGNKRMVGVQVVVWQDGSVYDQLETDAKGNYDFELPLRHLYVFSFEIVGYGMKRIEVDVLGVPLSVLGSRNMNLDLTLFELLPGFDTSILESPYGKGSYSADENTVIFDSNYTVRMRNRVEAEFARLEGLEGAAAAMQDNFDGFIEKGNRSMSSQEWQKALDFYESALSIFPENASAIVKRDEAQNQVDLANAAGAADRAFETVLSEAEAALSAGALDEAVSLFESAAEMNPSAPQPPDGLRRVEERRKASKGDVKYLELIADADERFDREQYERAIALYSKASSMKPSERYPRDRKSEAQQRLDDLADQAAFIVELTMEYEALIDEANDVYRDDDYIAALPLYEEASQLLPAERYPKQRAEECRKRITEKEADESQRREREARLAERESSAAELREKRLEYDAINDDADVFFRNDDYAKAIERYAAASEVMPDERYPKQRMEEAQRRLDEAAAKTAARSGSKQEEESEEARTKADEETDGGDVAAEAQRMEAEAGYAAEIEAGDAAFDVGSWEVARRAYESALNWKSEDRYATLRLVRIDKEAAREADAVNKVSSERAKDQDANRLKNDEAAAAEAAAASADRDAARANRMASETERLAAESAERERKEAMARERAEKLATALNTKESDEVERYYREALKSEDRARMVEVENRKAANQRLHARAADAARDRLEGDLEELSGVMDQQIAMSQQGSRLQADRVEQQGGRETDWDRQSRRRSDRGREQVSNGADAADAKKSQAANLQSAHANDYNSSVPELDKQKGMWRKLFGGMRRAAEERRSIRVIEGEDLSRAYRSIGVGSDIRRQEKYREVRGKERRVSRRMAKREEEAKNRAYEARVSEEAKSFQSKDPDNYQLSEEDVLVLMGVHEESYDIPNGLVIERTVRTGNLVVRYRKVVTKTGVYYFKGDRSVTIDTWKRETSVVLD